MEARGFSKPKMTDEERVDENKKFQRFVSLDFMNGEDDDEDEEDLESSSEY